MIKMMKDNFKFLNFSFNSLVCKMFQITSETFTADFVGTEDETKLEDIEALDLVTDLASLANLLSPATPTSLASSSMGCLRAVMSLNVQRNNTTTSLSFLIGDMCINSHSGVPWQWPMLFHDGIRTISQY